MQLDMLQDDLFPSPQDTKDTASDAASATEKTNAQKTSPYKKLDVAEPVAVEQKQQPVEQYGSEGAAPMTATLLAEEPEDSKPIGSMLPVLTRTSKQAEAKAPHVPVLESKSSVANDDDDLVEEDEEEGLDESSKEWTDKAPGAFKTISEVASFLAVPQHVLRFWESRFSQIKPLKMRGGRRYYRPEDIEILSTVKHLLYKQGYTIKGAKKVFSSRNRAALDSAHETPIVVKPVTSKTLSDKPVIDEKKKKQLSNIRNELLGLRDVLSPYIA